MQKEPEQEPHILGSSYAFSFIVLYDHYIKKILRGNTNLGNKSTYIIFIVACITKPINFFIIPSTDYTKTKFLASLVQCKMSL